ncbi:MAG: trypsin-like peptidase domain-containing protein [Candidatus Nomurabacteria bacterium]|jgi:serine protease Do|nr:trypsin-like peptidase domain-containing protein [Candidatus Nomurabacteria bacterium]
MKEHNKNIVIGAVTVLLFVVLVGVAGFGGAALYDRLLDVDEVNTELVSIKEEGDAISAAVDKIGPSVVSIVVSGKTVTNNSYYNLFFGGNLEQETQSAGTGVIISKDGYVLTNKHVIAENTTKVKIVTRDGVEYDDVEVVARDPLTDIAFLKIKDAKDLTPATLGDSSSVKVGTKVIAVGNALGEYQNTVTSGIVGGIGRSITAQTSSGVTETLTNLLQTDAAINPGNSGGPLATLDGKVVGINTAIVEDAQGIGFAIPVSEIQGTVDSVLSSGKIEKAYLGVRYVNLTKQIAEQNNLPVENGAYLVNSNDAPIIKNGPADKAGLRTGDIITEFNGEKIDASHTLASYISQHKPGDSVKLTVYRGDNTINVDVKLEKIE